jgi:hypothetical protein
MLLAECASTMYPRVPEFGAHGIHGGLKAKLKIKIKKNMLGEEPLACVHSESKIYRLFPTHTPNRKIAKNTAKIGCMV